MGNFLQFQIFHIQDKKKVPSTYYFLCGIFLGGGVK